MCTLLFWMCNVGYGAVALWDLWVYSCFCIALPYSIHLYSGLTGPLWREFTGHCRDECYKAKRCKKTNKPTNPTMLLPHIPHCTFRIVMCTFLFWMVHCRVCDVGFVKLVYQVPVSSTLKNAVCPNNYARCSRFVVLWFVWFCLFVVVVVVFRGCVLTNVFYIPQDYVAENGSH